MAKKFQVSDLGSYTQTISWTWTWDFQVLYSAHADFILKGGEGGGVIDQNGKKERTLGCVL